MNLLRGACGVSAGSSRAEASDLKKSSISSWKISGSPVMHSIRRNSVQIRLVHLWTSDHHLTDRAVILSPSVSQRRQHLASQRPAATGLRAGRDIGAVEYVFDVQRCAQSLPVLVAHPEIVRERGVEGRAGWDLVGQHKAAGHDGGHSPSVVVGCIHIVDVTHAGAKAEPGREPTLHEIVGPQ